MSRASLYRSASILQRPNENGEMSAIPFQNGATISAIPNIGAPPTPPPPPAAAGFAPQDVSIEEQIAMRRARDQSEIIGEAISREPSFMVSQAGTPHNLD